MGMLSSFGREAAAGEILAAIRKKIEENKNKPDALVALYELKSFVEQVQSDAAQG